MAKGKRCGRAPTLRVGLPGPDPQGMDTLVAAHLDHMRVRNFSEDTIRDRAYCLSYFERWCAERGLTRPSEITKPILERYQRFLFLYRKRDGAPLGFSTQHDRLGAVRAFFKYLSRTNQILSNPASELEMPRVPHRLPRSVLSVPEVERILALPDVQETLGLRDRAMLELLYSTGLRRKELCRLSVYDLDFERGTLLVREGKWMKDRMVPVGERALAWAEKYLLEARGCLLVEPDPRVLFLGQLGEPLDPGYVTSRVSQYIRKALHRKAGCHIFRHTMATLMLEGGADIRFIQEMLGHSNLQSTQIYTRVALTKLKQIHSATHPGAKLERQQSAAEPAHDEPATESAQPTVQEATADAADVLLSSLAAEAVEDELDAEPADE
jgi:integrase/recombinase XerD